MKRSKSQPSHIEPWINSYVQIVRRKINLTEWRIDLNDKPCPNDSLGECEIVYGQHLATISLNKDYKKEKPETLRNTIVHELLHCYMSPITESATQVMEPFEDDIHGRKIVQSTINSIEYQIERVIDRLSEIISPTMPLPKIPTEKKKIKKKNIKK
jgi:DNA polymerase II small subunit/DNA polymerase delta subunit B